MASLGRFLYFAYGSNLFSKRIHVNNPSAIPKTTAKLQDYKLEFNAYSEGWKGAAATIIESVGDHVWGVVWEIDNGDMGNLDRQEGVDRKIYKYMDVDVVTEEGQMLRCRTYQMLLPWSGDHKPSPQYKRVIVNGAYENKLPKYYIELLEVTEDNGYSGKDTHLSLLTSAR